MSIEHAESVRKVLTRGRIASNVETLAHLRTRAEQAALDHEARPDHAAEIRMAYAERDVEDFLEQHPGLR